MEWATSFKVTFFREPFADASFPCAFCFPQPASEPIRSNAVSKRAADFFFRKEGTPGAPDVGIFFIITSVFIIEGDRFLEI